MKTTQVSKETTIGAKETYSVRTFDLTYVDHTSVKRDLL